MKIYFIDINKYNNTEQLVTRKSKTAFLVLSIIDDIFSPFITHQTNISSIISLLSG